MQVLKFGGTSMGDEDTWRRVLSIIQSYERPFVVVSATSRTTRQLLGAAETALREAGAAQSCAEEIRERHSRLVTNFMAHFPDISSSVVKECQLWIEEQTGELMRLLTLINEEQKLDPSRKDAVASLGERLSSYLLAKCGAVAGFPTCWIDAADIIRTDSDFGRATPDTAFLDRQADHLRDLLESGNIPVMGGYYGKDAKGNLTTLGFEGSDYTASLMGAALSAESIEIWTDVSGIFTCDPRVVEGARPIPELSFQEATELAYFGAKILHPSTTKPASHKDIPILVKNIFDPGQPGTRIASKSLDTGEVKAMSFKENCTVITVTSSNTIMGYEFLAGIFDVLRWHHLPVDVVTTTEASVSIAIENSDKVEEAVQQLQTYGAVETEFHQGIISLVGTTDEARSLVGKILEEIKSDSVRMISFSKSKRNLNIVLEEKHVLPSVKAIHRRLFTHEIG